VAEGTVPDRVQVQIVLAKWEICTAIEQDPQATLAELIQMRMVGVLDANNLAASQAALVTALALSPLGMLVLNVTERLDEVRTADPLYVTLELEEHLAVLVAEDAATIRKPPK
jgi:hypothetical protein